MDFSTESTDIVICTHMKKVNVRDNVRTSSPEEDEVV